MSNAKPNFIVHIVKGKLLSAVQGLSDVLNWVIDFCANFDAGKGLKMTGVEKGEPKLEINLVEGDGITLEEYPENAIKISSIGGGSVNLVSGSDSNIVITDLGDGRKSIDVYYV